MDGSTTLTFVIGSRTFDADFLVADISNTILLGLDFFAKHGCKLDFRTCTFHCGESKVQCTNVKGEPLQANVQPRSEMRIPRCTERIIPAQVNRVWTQEPAFVEPSNKTQGIVVASSLAEPRDRQLHLRLLNYTDDEIVIPAEK